MAEDLEIAQSDELDEEEPLGEDEERLKAQVLALSEQIELLAAGQYTKVEDLDQAQEMAQAIKPYIDRLVSLQRLLDPVEGIIEKREQIEELRADLVEDIAEVEDLSDGLAGDIEAPLLSELQGELATVKRDRKIFVSQVEEEEEEEGEGESPLPSRRGSGLLEMDVAERMERIFGARFLSLERVENIFGLRFKAEQKKTWTRLLDRVWQTVFTGDEIQPHVERNRIKTLQKTFADYALLFRSPSIATSSGEVPTSLDGLRRRFGSFFVSASSRHIWYADQDFYKTSITRGHWALVDRQYLNCTFKKPSIRLLMYARANNLPPKAVRQKSVLEDVYDRIVLELNLKERFFDNCNSITSTTYEPEKDPGLRQVYVYYKDSSIRISGKRGTPHWRPTRPNWPGVLPAVVFV